LARRARDKRGHDESNIVNSSHMELGENAGAALMLILAID
jgi:hypothetical protein